ncbi:serine/threonine protein kinase [Rhizobium leguminosarum bv. trifolii]|uniref:Protein kinase domain-containing protein n=1 Tax=Rhizobium leguminosarum bv. trifolii TaxID=386 RepID=A0A1B8R3Z2_RHILT|nr:serine/threonine-protein kinase [Rhizobium leguminosarum]AOO93870.1 protein kinase domain-containing protein [Rhizobium leguminosarum bv. trifolii]OBY03495.1 serine/threonine protein kinase [Rhizobium leguminosarum bv. trifolii]
MIDPLPGDIFRKSQVLNNTYEIEGVLGRGGTGEVYRASNKITGRVVALKALKRELSANANYLELMKREEEMRGISHDAVVRYTDCSQTAEGHVYLVMDYVAGTPLSDYLERGGISPGDLLVVAQRVAEGLVATHERKIVHRDLSPDNIILRNGRPEEAVIIDFGIAKDSTTGARTIVGNEFAGKYEYAAPEQLHGRAEPRSDLYALGASLLATFRGKIPNVGTSPGEVVRYKERRLDTAGVPEPLKALIDDLTQPDASRRPPTAAAVVKQVSELWRTGRTGQQEGGPGARRGWRPWLAILAIAAVAAIAGLWFAGFPDGLFVKSLPVEAPYKLSAGLDGRHQTNLSGFAPDADQRQAILAGFTRAAGLAAPKDALGLAKGEPSARWAQDIDSFFAAADGLVEWKLDVTDRTVRLTGLAPDKTSRDAAVSQFNEASRAAGYQPIVRIAAGPRSLTPDELKSAIAPMETCGPLGVHAPEGANFPLGSTVTIRGAVAASGDVEALRQTLAPRLGDRDLRFDTTVLSSQLCVVQSLLPDAPQGPMTIVLGYGDKSEPNLSGIYAVGDNPVIDVLAPTTIKNGYLWVAIADVTGNLFNVLPNIKRPDNALSSLGTVSNGMRTIRVAYSTADGATDPAKLSFAVDNTFGRSLIIAMQTDRPLFSQLRPTTESTKSFAEDLHAVIASGQVSILSTTTRLIDTRN